MKPLAPNTLLQQRYLISEIIGKGGMGEVYLATDTRLGNKVAVKRTTVGDDATLADAFENEARTLAALRHPVLPNVSDHFLEHDEQFLIMDYISGHDLSKRLKESNKPFPLNWVLFWADQLLDALSYLHTHDPPIIHRDIKPQNLKLTGENQIVLLDFGLSKNSVGQTRVTTSGSIVGYTPHYAPMEQIRGTGTNAKSDLYALSATLYQLLTNTVPPDALTRADSLLGNLPDPLRPLSEVNSEVSGPLSEAIMKGMEISQDRRFESAREMQKVMRKAYNSMQASMSAETVAFNLGEPSEPSVSLAPPDADTEFGNEVPPPAAVPDVVDAGDDLSADATEVFSPEDLGLPVKSASDSLSDVLNNEPEGDKTAVLLDHVFPTASPEESEPEPPVVPAGFDTNDDFSVEGDTGFESEFESGGAPVPDATVPLISVEGDGGFEDFTPAELGEPEMPHDAAAGAAPPGATATGQTAAGPGGSKSAAKAAGSKSSTGKYVGILVGIAAVLFLLVGSVAAGLWFLSRSGSGTTESGADTTPSVQESVEPTTEATVEETPPVEETPGDNVNSEQTPDANSSPEFEPTSTPAIQSPPTRTRTPVSRRTPVKRVTPPKVTKTPVKPPATKTPKKKKDPGVL